MFYEFPVLIISWLQDLVTMIMYCPDESYKMSIEFISFKTHIMFTWSWMFKHRTNDGNQFEKNSVNIPKTQNSIK